MNEATLPSNEAPNQSTETENKPEQEGNLKKVWTGFRNRIGKYSFEDSRLGKMKEAAVEQIEKLSQSDKLKFLDGVSRLGNTIEGFKSRKMAEFSIGLANTFKNKHLKHFFQEYSDHYEERMSQAYGDAQEKDLKDMARVRGVGRGIAGNFIRFGRILSDFTQANPFRHIMAGSMFVGHNAEMVKKVRLKSEGAITKTRVGSDERDVDGNLVDQKGFDRAFEEAQRLYEMAQVNSKDGKVDAASLDKAYRENLPKDVLDRIARSENFDGLNFTERGMIWHMKKGAEKIERQLEKIDTLQISEEEKEQKRQVIYARNKKLLEDLDAMVGDQGTIDTFAYLSRSTEKTGKAVAMAMTIQSIPRVIKMVGKLGQIGMEWTGSSVEASELRMVDRPSIWQRDHSLDGSVAEQLSSEELQSIKQDLEKEMVALNKEIEVAEKLEDQTEANGLKTKRAEIDHKLHQLIEPIREKMKLDMAQENEGGLSRAEIQERMSVEMKEMAGLMKQKEELAEELGNAETFHGKTTSVETRSVEEIQADMRENQLAIDNLNQKMKAKFDEAVSGENTQTAEEPSEEIEVEQASDGIKDWQEKRRVMLEEKGELEQKRDQLIKEGVSVVAINQQINAIDGNLEQLQSKAPHAEELFPDENQAVEGVTTEQGNEEAVKWAAKRRLFNSEIKALEAEREIVGDHNQSRALAIDQRLSQIRQELDQNNSSFNISFDQKDGELEVDNDAVAAKTNAVMSDFQPEAEASARENGIVNEGVQPEEVEQKEEQVEKVFELGKEVEVKRGDSIWSVAKKYLQSNGTYNDMVESTADADTVKALEAHNIDRVKDLIVANPGKYGITVDSVDKMNISQLKGVKWQQAFNDAFLEKGLTDGLSSEQVDSIVENNEKLKKFFSENQNAPRTSENYEAILRGEGDNGQAGGGVIVKEPIEIDFESKQGMNSQVESGGNYKFESASDSIDQKTFHAATMDMMNSLSGNAQAAELLESVKDMTASEMMGKKYYDLVSEEEIFKNPSGYSQEDIDNLRKIQDLLEQANEVIGQPEEGEKIMDYWARYYGHDEMAVVNEGLASQIDASPETEKVEVAPSLEKGSAPLSEQLKEIVLGDELEASSDELTTEQIELRREVVKGQATDFFNKILTPEQRVDRLTLQMKDLGNIDIYQEEMVNVLKEKGLSPSEDHGQRIKSNLRKLLEGSSTEKQEARSEFVEALESIEDLGEMQIDEGGSGEKEKGDIEIEAEDAVETKKEISVEDAV